ncbi:MAG: STAS-like domain-containing protein [Hyphomicrobiales bacterium]
MSNKELLIDFAKDYSPYPGPRHEELGPFSAERFRDEFLVPNLKNGLTIVIDVKGMLGGFGSSFLDEAFIQLKDYGVSADFAESHIVIKGPFEKFKKDIQKALAKR